MLRAYNMKKSRKNDWEYILTIPYDDDAELDRRIEEVIMEAASQADMRHCFIEADVVSLDDPERSW